MTLLRAEKLLAAERIEIRSAIVSAVYNYWYTYFSVPLSSLLRFPLFSKALLSPLSSPFNTPPFVEFFCSN
jgi:hypothetical protein